MTNKMNNLLNGLLIEGTDYSGKTTVTSLLAERLKESGKAFSHGKCYISGNPTVRFLDKEASRHDDMLTRDYYYSAAIMLDLQILSQNPPETFLLQDRHWFSQVGRNQFFHDDKGLLPVGLIEQSKLSFRHNIYLTSNLETKRNRAGLRPPKSPRDRLLMSEPIVHQRYDEYLTTIIPRDEQWSIIDTSDKSPSDIVDLIERIVQLG